MGTSRHTQGEPVWVPLPDGRRLFAQVLDGPAGRDLATVVFEAGSGASRSSWGLVQPRVGRWTRAIVYDRSGLGRSAPDPSSRTLDHMADDLNALLDHFGPGPFILVGHSAGGPIVRLAASRQPGRVSGLVLVDPTDEAADVLFSRAFRIGERLVLAVFAVLSRVPLRPAHGALPGCAGRTRVPPPTAQQPSERPPRRTVFAWLFRRMTTSVPDDVAADLDREGFTPHVVRTQTAQARTYLDELEAWRREGPATGDIPVTVVSGALPGHGMSTSVRAAAIASHAVRSAAGPRGRHVVAHRSGHDVPLTDPELVAGEIRRIATNTAPRGTP